MADPIPDETLQTLARGLYANGETYGFGFPDWVRFANVLLDLAMERAESDEPRVKGGLPLVGEQVIVRAPVPEDRGRLAAWLTEPSGRFFLLSRSTGRTQALDELWDDSRSVIGVVALPDETVVGVVAYLDVGDGRAELRKIIGDPACRGRGFGKEAARLWVAHGLHNLKLRKIYLYTLASNLPNIRLNEQLGFRVEGVLRREVQVDGRAHDVLRMARVV